MDLTSFQMQTVVHQFDAICKKVLRDERADYYRSADARGRHEILFCELDEHQVNTFETVDQYARRRASSNRGNRQPLPHLGTAAS